MRTIRSFIYTVQPYERGIQEDMGKYARFVMPGLGFQVPIFQVIRVRDVREHTMDIPAQPLTSSLSKSSYDKPAVLPIRQ